MADIYIHIWKDKEGKSIVMEHRVSFDIESSIEEYWEQEGYFEYMHTIKLNAKTQKWNLINIEKVITDDEEFKREEEEEVACEENQYGSYFMQVSSYYNSTRL